MIAELVYVYPGKIELDRFALEVGVFHLGRSSACDFVVNDATVSRRHVKISVADASIHVDDLK